MVAFIESILVSTPAVVVAVEVAHALPIPNLVRNLVTRGRKSLHLLRSDRISDHWKERVLPAYATTMLKASLLIAALMIFLFLLFAIGLVVGARIFSVEFEWTSVLHRTDYLVSSFLIASVYLFARRLIRNV